MIRIPGPNPKTQRNSRSTNICKRTCCLVVNTETRPLFNSGAAAKLGGAYHPGIGRHAMASRLERVRKIVPAALAQLRRRMDVLMQRSPNISANRFHIMVVE